jgi:hypothetical protein
VEALFEISKPQLKYQPLAQELSVSTAPSQLPDNQLQQLQPPRQPAFGEEQAATSGNFSPGGGGGFASGRDGGADDPRALQWVDVSADAARSTFTADLPWSLAPTAAGRRQYLLIEAYIEVRSKGGIVRTARAASPRGAVPCCVVLCCAVHRSVGARLCFRGLVAVVPVRHSSTWLQHSRDSPEPGLAHLGS